MREDSKDQGTEPIEQPASDEAKEPPTPETRPEPFGTENMDEGEYSGD